MKRKKYTHEYKAQIIKECEETGNISVVSRKYDLNPSLTARWIRDSKLNPSAEKQLQNNVLQNNGQAIEKLKDAEEALKQNEQLKKLIGEKELEILILRDLLKKTNTPLPVR
jgi:Transposase.